MQNNMQWHSYSNSDVSVVSWGSAIKRRHTINLVCSMGVLCAQYSIQTLLNPYPSSFIIYTTIMWLPHLFDSFILHIETILFRFNGDRQTHLILRAFVEHYVYVSYFTFGGQPRIHHVYISVEHCWKPLIILFIVSTQKWNNATNQS